MRALDDGIGAAVTGRGVLMHHDGVGTGFTDRGVPIPQRDSERVHDRSVGYEEHAAPPLLAPWMACTWERRGGGVPPIRVLPDGCIDIVWTENASAEVVGPNTTAFLVSVASDALVVGARMRPGGAPALLGINPIELRDTRVSLDDALGEAGRRLAATLDDAQCPRTALVDLLAEHALSGRRPDAAVTEAVARLREGTVGVAGVATSLGYSERQLRRRFDHAIGYGPKQLSRVLRLRRAVAVSRTSSDLAHIAVCAGYADQAHLGHECRSLAGIAPSALLIA